MTFLIWVYGSPDLVQNQQEFAQSHNCMTARFRSSGQTAPEAIFFWDLNFSLNQPQGKFSLVVGMSVNICLLVYVCVCSKQLIVDYTQTVLVFCHKAEYISMVLSILNLKDIKIA